MSATLTYSPGLGLTKSLESLPTSLTAISRSFTKLSKTQAFKITAETLTLLSLFSALIVWAMAAPTL